MESKDYAALVADISDTVVFVSDIDTYELYYLNPAAKKVAGITDDSYVGQKCYKLMQGKDSPCEFCTNEILKYNRFYYSEFYNPKINRHFSLHDVMLEKDPSGRNLCVKYSRDITDIKARDTELKRKLELDQTQLECLKIFQFEPNIKKAIQKLIEIIARYHDANRAYIFDFDYERDIMTYDYEWCKSGVKPQINLIKEVPLSYASDWIEMFTKHGEFYVSNTEEYSEKNKKAYEILKAQEIDSLMVSPIIIDGVITGFLGVDDPQRYCNNFDLLKSTTFFICEEYKQRKHLEILEKLSFMDGLTNVFNRNKLVTILDDKKNKFLSNIGVCFVDINGLKAVNDFYGHEKGDRLIVDTVNVLKKVFRNNIYRAGGDEFIIICFDIDKQKFDNKIKKLKNIVEDLPNISIAIGDIWVENTNNLELELGKADQYMYENKQIYYRTMRDKEIIKQLQEK